MGNSNAQTKTEDKFIRGLRAERKRIIQLLEKDIEFQHGRLKHDFESDKSIRWRIEGIKLIIKKVKAW